MKLTFSCTLFLLALFTNAQVALACTDFQLKTQEGDIFVGRSMEWGTDLHSCLVVHPYNEAHASTAPQEKSGLQWKSKYSYVGIDANGISTSLDGMNETGLSYGALWLPGYTKYQDVSPNQSQMAINFIDFGDWILGNFCTVEEVKAALPNVRVWANAVPSFGGIPTAHVTVHDAQGKNLVVEFIQGEQKLYDNPIGVATNSPPFDWHLVNLSNYVMISPNNHGPIQISDTKLSPPGQGNGFFGVPGDWTPPSRFIRTVAILSSAKEAKTAAEGLNLTEHILNAVDIPKGDIREKISEKEYSDYTQWAVIKDLTNKVFYFRSYNNLMLRALDMKKLDWKKDDSARYITIEDQTPTQSTLKKIGDRGIKSE